MPRLGASADSRHTAAYARHSRHPDEQPIDPSLAVSMDYLRTIERAAGSTNRAQLLNTLVRGPTSGSVRCRRCEEASWLERS